MARLSMWRTEEQPPCDKAGASICQSWVSAEWGGSGHQVVHTQDTRPNDHGAWVAGDLKGAAGPGSGLVVGRVSEGVNNFVPCKSPVLAEGSMT